MLRRFWAFLHRHPHVVGYSIASILAVLGALSLAIAFAFYRADEAEHRDRDCRLAAAQQVLVLGEIEDVYAFLIDLTALIDNPRLANEVVTAAQHHAEGARRRLMPDLSSCTSGTRTSPLPATPGG